MSTLWLCGFFRMTYMSLLSHVMCGHRVMSLVVMFFMTVLFMMMFVHGTDPLLFVCKMHDCISEF
jgi:hypothetical protein